MLVKEALDNKREKKLFGPLLSIKYVSETRLIYHPIQLKSSCCNVLGVFIRIGLKRARE